MLRLPPFDYHAPKSVAEAVALKAQCHGVAEKCAELLIQSSY